MKHIHALYRGKTRKYSSGEMAGCHAAQYFQVLVCVLKSHKRAMKRVFYIHDMIICPEIIIKNASGSNDNIFFSIVYIPKGFVFLGFGKIIRYHERIGLCWKYL